MGARVLGVAASLLWVPVSNAKPLFIESFDYVAGEELGEFSSASVWENDKDEIKIGPGSLKYDGLASSAGNRVSFEPAEPNPDGVRTVVGAWPEQFSGTLYVSFILRLESVAGISGSGEGTALLSIGHPSNSSPLFSINLIRDESLRLGVVKYPSDGSVVSSSAFFSEGVGQALSAEGATDYLVVAKYEWVEGEANDKVALWVNPTTLGTGEDLEEKLLISDGPDGQKQAGRLTLCRGPHVSLDELRLGRSWAEVTPPGESPREWWPLAALAIGLAAAGFWITFLRHKVKERSAALSAQIQQLQEAEQQRLVERERARIAHDLHDELGADITEISMLATRASGPEGRECMDQVVDRTRHMVAKLEEIVWAMNPKHDSLGALVDYFAFFADRFLGLANIKLVVDSDEDAAGLALDAHRRHQLFLVFREALANVVKHSGASEVRLKVSVNEQVVRVTVADNGCGMQESAGSGAGHEGVANMRRRVEKLGGRFDVAGETGRGTTVTFSVPLDS